MKSLKSLLLVLAAGIVVEGTSFAGKKTAKKAPTAEAKKAAPTRTRGKATTQQQEEAAEQEAALLAQIINEVKAEKDRAVRAWGNIFHRSKSAGDLQKHYDKANLSVGAAIRFYDLTCASVASEKPIDEATRNKEMVTLHRGIAEEAERKFLAEEARLDAEYKADFRSGFPLTNQFNTETTFNDGRVFGREM